ncbi:TetR/AcrR family transcriptional regulator [Desertibacillus haloalkaliphilus]|uniref:TetR/AcrR family transcriptional regulator n=1 Tax=Desertibacillus haloalkaliphilus TaxID=1328930 RepID=UPI001C26B500|nr:TetR/AcrR family transcriptional regulator [Desertibacillus haloalkaliphilus]MBU8906130.1 TetR/AcrR family transcriptional regulator [Desertibacillus haloalkaliphilus]
MKKNNRKTLTERQKRAMKTRKALLDSALRLFNEKGFDEVHIEEIAKEAGTSKGSFYTYFKSKDAVFLEKYKEIDEFYLNVFNKLPKEMSSPEKIRVLLSEGINLFLELGHEFVTIVAKSQLDTNMPPYVFSSDRTINQLIFKIVEEGQAREQIRNDLTETEIADMIICFYRGIYIEWCYFNGNFDIFNKGNQYIDLFINGVLKKKKNSLT